MFEEARSTNDIQFSPYLASEGILIDNIKVEAGDNLIKTPEALQPTQATTTSFTARWERVNGAESYLLDVYTKNDTEKEYLLKDKEVTTTSQPVDGLTEGKTYYFTVRAKKGEAVSDYSNEIEVIEVIASLPSPEALAATNITAEGFTANWKAVEKATQYDVKLTRTETMQEAKSVKLLEEDFSGVTAGTLTEPDFGQLSGDIDHYTKLPGWDTYMPCFANGYAGVSPYGSGGYIRTPGLDLSHSNGAFSLTINMAELQYGSPVDGGTVSINVYDGETLKETKQVTLKKGFDNYTLDFNCGTAKCYVEISYSGSNKIFIDEMSISQELKEGESYSYLVETKELGDVTSCHFNVPLSENISYSYRVTAYARTVVGGEIGMLASDPSSAMEVKDIGSSISNVTEAAEAKVYAAEGGIVAELTRDAVINVYNTSGRQIVMTPGHQGTNRINVASGPVIVKIGEKSVKVVVR